MVVTVIRIAIVLLGMACGFGAAVWVLVAITNFRVHHNWAGFWYLAGAVYYIAAAIIAIGRLIYRFDDSGRGISIAVLTPIIIVPPAIQFAAYLRARNLIRQQRSIPHE